MKPSLIEGFICGNLEVSGEGLLLPLFAMAVIRDDVASDRTITFLFTDIEGSTRMWETHPDDMRASLERHDVLIRKAIAGANGYVFKTVGDAFCAAFSTATDALNAALTVQVGIHNEAWPSTTPIKVRLAVHTGVAECRDNDYFGPHINRVSRLLSTGHGLAVTVNV